MSAMGRKRTLAAWLVALKFGPIRGLVSGLLVSPYRFVPANPKLEHFQFKRHAVGVRTAYDRSRPIRLERVHLAVGVTDRFDKSQLSLSGARCVAAHI